MTNLEQQLTTAKAILTVLENQAAGYTVLTIPAHLQVQLEEKRKEVTSLKLRLAQLQGTAAAAQVVDNLPRFSNIFVGRVPEIEQCLEALSPEERGWGVAIDGIGGIGKTALALEVAFRARKAAQFDAYAFASAKTSWLSPEGVRQETLSLSSLDAFCREFAKILGEREVDRLPDATKRRRALLEALRGRRILLIWDNLETLTAEEREAIAEFLRKLPSPNKAIVTSRRRVGESAVTVRLGQLQESEALELMAEFAKRHPSVKAELGTSPPAPLLQGEGSQIPPFPRREIPPFPRREGGLGGLGQLEACRALYAAAGGNPLALNWALGSIQLKGCSLAAVTASLRDAARSPDLYGFLFADAVADLSQTDKGVLAALAGFFAPATASALSDASGFTPPEVSTALEKLTVLSLVNDLPGGRYGLYPLVRTYVGAAIASGTTLNPEPQRRVLRYWLDYAQKYGGQDKDAYQTFDRLEAEWRNLEAAGNTLRQLAGIPGTIQDEEAARMLNDLAEALSSFLWFRGYWEEIIRLSEWAYQGMQALGNWQAAGWRAYHIAWIYYYRGEAERLYQDALAAYRELGEENREAIVLNDLGSVARSRKEYDAAETYYRQALALSEKLENKEGQASYCGSLGLLELDRNRPAAARPWYERELALAQEVGQQDFVAQAQAGLACVLESEGRYGEALSLARQALAIQERLRDQNLAYSQNLVARLEGKG